MESPSIDVATIRCTGCGSEVQNSVAPGRLERVDPCPCGEGTWAIVQVDHAAVAGGPARPG